MLEMGDPVSILDLAKRMIRLSGYQVGVDIPIDIVGARPGEKFDEELRTPEEEVLTTHHPYINQLIPITASAEQFATGLDELRTATEERDDESVRRLLFSVGASSPAGTQVLAPDLNGSGNGAVGPSRGADPESARGAGDDHERQLAKDSPAESSEQVLA